MRDLKLIPYRQCLQELCQRFMSVKFRHIPRIHNEIADALATLSSMLQHPDKAYIDPVHIQSRDQHAYCNAVEEDLMENLGSLISSDTFSQETTQHMPLVIKRGLLGVWLVYFS